MSKKIYLNEVHIYRFELTSENIVPGILSEDEVNYGQRLIRQEHRVRFWQARIHLRFILASYLNRPPEDIQFQIGVHGKMYLINNPMGLQFNVSHSKEWALYAITLDHEVGVDIEWIDSKLEVTPLVERFFTTKEKQIILELPETHRVAAFYHYWTRKEAYLKALGIGLSGLSQISFEEVDQKTLPLVELAPGFASAVGLLAPRLGDYQLYFF